MSWICHKHLASFHPAAMDENRMPNAKKIHVPKRVVLGRCVSILLASASFSQSQTATPENQPTPRTESSPAASTTPLIPQAEHKTPAQPSPTLPTDSVAQPAPPALPAESPSPAMESQNPAQPSAAPVSPLIPPVAGPGALPSPNSQAKSCASNGTGSRPGISRLVANSACASKGTAVHLIDGCGSNRALSEFGRPPRS
jgi:hypothetical protein